MKDGIVNCISAEPLQVVITLSCYTSVFVDIGGLLVLGFNAGSYLWFILEMASFNF
jgi:hypothetical protein